MWEINKFKTVIEIIYKSLLHPILKTWGKDIWPKKKTKLGEKKKSVTNYSLLI